MDLVVIYGPPGVGKLTTAKELSRLTGDKLFHNHLTLNYVSELFDWDETFWRLVRVFRLATIEAAAAADMSVIFTCVYPQEEDDEHLRQFQESYERQGGRMCLVQLTCTQEEHEKRIGAEGRAELHKMIKVSSLRRTFEQEPRMALPAAGFDSLCIDNTDVAPEDSARRIIAHYGLPLQT